MSPVSLERRKTGAAAAFWQAAIARLACVVSVCVRILLALACVAGLVIAVAHPLARAEAPHGQPAPRVIDKIEWSPDGRWLAYLTLGGRSEVHVIRRDGKADRKLAASTYGGFSWSPDSRHIAVTDVGLQYPTLVFFADGRLVRSFDGLFRDWSPKAGRMLLEAPEEPGGRRRAIYVAEIRTRRVRRLVDGITPDWSPDGRRVAFSAPADAGPWVCRAGPNSHARIFVIGIDGRGLRRVSSDSPGQHRCHFGPTWAPGSKRIAYGDIVASYIPEKYPDAFVIRPGSRRTIRLGEGVPTWSPNGRFLALRSGVPPQLGLSIVRPSGEKQVFFRCAEDFSWAPKRSAVAFFTRFRPLPGGGCSRGSGGGTIYVTPADGSHSPRRLAAGRQPAWSRLGSIALLRWTACGDRVFLVAPNGRGLRALTPCPSAED
jgi:Tol biopolymer transport system component